MNPQSQQTKSNNSTTASQGTATTNPWGVQAPFLTSAFNGASDARGVASAFQPGQLDAFNKMVGYGMGNGAIPASSANAGEAISGAAASAVPQGLFGLANFNPAGNTQSNIDNANKYVAGQNIPAQVQADIADANREANYV